MQAIYPGVVIMSSITVAPSMHEAYASTLAQFRIMSMSTHLESVIGLKPEINSIGVFGCPQRESEATTDIFSSESTR